jgi:hypothetical protein
VILGTKPESFSFDLDLPPFIVSNPTWPPHRPIFPADIDEYPPLVLSEMDRQSIHFFNHWAIDALLPFLRIPDRVLKVHPMYVVTLFKRADIAFVSRAHFRIISALSQLLMSSVSQKALVAAHSYSPVVPRTPLAFDIIHELNVLWEKVPDELQSERPENLPAFGYGRDFNMPTVSLKIHRAISIA